MTYPIAFVEALCDRQRPADVPGGAVVSETAAARSRCASMVRSARWQSAGCGGVLSNPALDCTSRASKSAADNVDNVDIHWQEQPGTV